MPDTVELSLTGAGQTEALGAALGAAATPGPGLVVWLSGELGAGKTTLVRGLLRRLGHAGRVPSPTYTLLEPYDLPGWQVCHADLYRLDMPADAEQLGLREAAGPGRMLLVEWPERGAGHVPLADLRVALEVAGDGRRARLVAASPAGVAVLGRLMLSKPL